MVTFTQYHGMNFSSVIRCNHKIFYIWSKNSTKFRRFCNRSYLFSYNCFSEICCDAVKNTHCYQFLCKDLKVSPWKMFSQILWIWLSLVKLHSLEILKIIETRTLISAEVLKVILIIKIHSCKCILTRWVFSRIDSWGLSGCSPNPWK